MPRVAVTLESFLDYTVSPPALNLQCWQYLQDLCETVVYRYFQSQDCEEYIAMAVADLAGFILGTLVGGERPRNLRNVLFTRARNCCTNYRNHCKHSTAVEPSTLESHAHPGDWTASYADLRYEYQTIAEARALSLRVWQIYTKVAGCGNLEN